MAHTGKTFKIIVHDEMSPFVESIPKINEAGTREALELMEDAFRDRMARATFTWDSKNNPLWKIIRGRTTPSAMWWMNIFTNSLPFLYVDLGTPRHDIPLSPLTDHWLHFRKNYRAKTLPGNLTSRPGGQQWGPWRRARQVDHPGIAARELTIGNSEVVEQQFIHEILPATIMKYVNKYTVPPEAVEWVF